MQKVSSLFSYNTSYWYFIKYFKKIIKEEMYPIMQAMSLTLLYLD